MTTEKAIEAMLNGDNFFTCVLKGGCRMEKAACVIRRRNAINGWVAGSSSAGNKPGSLDTGCRDCAQGRQIEKEVSPGAVKAYQMRVGGHRKWNKKAMAKPGQVIDPSPEPTEQANEEPALTKVCPDTLCEAKGAPQPLDNFYNNKNTPDGKAWFCKACMLRKQKIYYQKRRDLLAAVVKSYPDQEPKQPQQEGKAQTMEQKQEITEKICRSDRCAHAGELQPIANFMKSKMSRDGYMHLCKVCYRAQATDRVGLKARSAKSLELRFDEYPEIMQLLASRAKAEFRTIESQALMILQRALAPQG